MNILEALVQTRNSIQSWVASNLAAKADKGHTHDDTYMVKNNPSGTGAFSLNRLSDSDIGDYSFSEGYDPTASGHSSHAEGYGAIASGDNSHAEGYSSTASGQASHAEGDGTSASGEAAHAEGCVTKAERDYSHAEGYHTTAGAYQHVQGKYNIDDSDSLSTSTYAHIVGNGNHTTPSNAHTIDWHGNAWFAGDVYVGSTSGTNKDEGSVKLATIADIISASNARISVGSYVGTEEPTKSLTFDFVPKFVFVYSVGFASGYNPSQFGIYPATYSNGAYMNGVRDDMMQTPMTATLSGTTLEWTDTTYDEEYNENDDMYYKRGDCALNGSGSYGYIAIG